LKEKIACLKDKKLYLFLLISILFYGALTKLNFMTDTYAVFETPAREMANHFIISGRFVTALVYAICVFLNLKWDTVYMILFIVAILASTLAMYKLYKIINREISNNIIASLISTLIIANLFSIELFLYIEKGVLMLSVLFCVLAFEQIIKYFEGKKKSLIYAIIYMILANFSYQGTVALFVALSLIWIIKYSKDVKTFIKNNLIVAVCYRFTCSYKLYISKICIC
jgi:hypothetical protein